MTYVVGIDPGPVTGLVGFEIDGPLKPVVMQVNAEAVPDVLMGVFRYYSNDIVMAAEEFVPSRLAQRGNAPAAAVATRAVLNGCREWARECEWRMYLRRAADVKPWASDDRLRAVGLLGATIGMGHARDAARHALYAAVLNLKLADPLSRKAGAVTGGTVTELHIEGRAR